eukprot:5661538-Prymnesium_polylepis.1
MQDTAIQSRLRVQTATDSSRGGGPGSKGKRPRIRVVAEAPAGAARARAPIKSAWARRLAEQRAAVCAAAERRLRQLRERERVEQLDDALPTRMGANRARPDAGAEMHRGANAAQWDARE